MMELWVFYGDEDVARIAIAAGPRNGELLGIGAVLYEVQDVVWVEADGHLSVVALQVR